ncbi:MAG: tRNA lysidine(34) synthetase TilS [Balneolales bacterium]|nr:tRNA lysidine(34) synthetase TilS [Balneolales bacterium]
MEHIPNLNQYKGGIVAGVSGGPDSMVLLSKLASCYCDKLIVAHVNYRKRGIESDADEKMVRDYCTSCGIPFLCSYFDEDYYSDKIASKNFHEKARVWRYSFFEKIRKGFGCNWIMTAHHKDDLYETMLFSLFRLQHAAPQRVMEMERGVLVRPLLKTDKSEILSFADINDIPYRIDDSNSENRYTRNAVRNKLVPLLREHFYGWEKAIDHHAELSLRASEAVNFALRCILVDFRENEAIFASDFHKAGVELQKQLIASWMEMVKPGCSKQAVTNRLMQYLHTIDSGKGFDLGAGLRLEKQGEFFVLYEVKVLNQ